VRRITANVCPCSKNENVWNVSLFVNLWGKRGLLSPIIVAARLGMRHGLRTCIGTWILVLCLSWSQPGATLLNRGSDMIIRGERRRYDMEGTQRCYESSSRGRFLQA
jgi:hypothetical protein